MLSKNICFVSAGIFQSIRKNSKRNALVLILFMMIFSGLFNSKSLLAQNANPTFLTVPITSVDKLGSYQYVILTNDADGDVVTVTGTTIPSWMNLSAHESAVSTFAGSGTTGSANGSGSAAEFSNLQALAVDANGNVYVAESGSHSIRKITKDGNVTTFAGSGTAGYADGTGTQAQFDFPQGVAIDANGNVFIGDKKNHRIRKITPEGVVTTFAGSGAVGFDSGTGTLATFNSPQGLSFGPNGNLYVADQLNHSIRKVTPAGFVDVLAGTGTSGFQDGNVAEFNAPSDVVIDENGVVYVADKLNRRIRKIASGVTTTLAGNGSTGFVNGAGSNARFGSPFSLAISNVGNIYVADETNHRIRSVSPSGEVSTVAGGETSGALNGVALNATFKNPRGITSDDKGNFYIADRTNAQIRKLVGTSYVLSGDPSASLGTHAVSLKATDTNGGESTQAFNVEISLGSVSFTSSPVTVVNSNEEYVYQIQTSGTTGEARNVAGTTLPSWMHFTSSLGSNVKTLAGVTSSSGNTDGPGTSAKFDNPTGMAVDDLGNVFVVDRSNHRIRKIALDGSVTTFAGSSSGYVNGTGTNAKFNNPRGIVIDKSGNLFVTDTNNGRVRKITPDGVVTGFAGSGAFGTNDGTGTLAKFASAYAIAIDESDNLYVTEQYRIRKITPEAVVSTLAGGSISPGFVNGTGSDARFGLMTGIAVADDGNIYVAGQQNNVIRKITQAGVVTTLAGSGTSGFSNGTGTSAVFNSPSGIAIADNGNLYVTDNDNYRVRKVTTAGVVTSFLGSGTQGVADGNGILAKFAGPYGITIDNNGNLYVNDQNTSVVKKVDGTSLKLIGIPAGQTGNHSVALTLTDGLGVTATQNFVVTIIDAIHPVITSPGTTSFVENGSGTAYTIAATDQNSVTYSLGTGNDEGLFNVTLDKVTFKTPPDFESPTDLGQDNTYIVQVRASDGTNTATKTVTITVTNIDDTSPVFTSPNSVSFKEKTAGIAYTISATDANAVSYRLGSVHDESLFNISNGNVSFKTLPDFANPIDQGNDNTYEINVIASDGVQSVSKLVTINVTDGTAPIFTSLSTATFAENSTGSVYQATTTDASPVTYSIEPGNDGAKFNINSGILSFKTVPDFEQPHDTDGNNSYLVNLKASDGENDTLFTLTINVTNVDDTPPAITSPMAVNFVENGTGTVYTIQATDANSITYSLLQVNDHALFNIVDNVITFKTAPDFEAPDGSTANNQYHIRVRAADANNVADRDVIITVTDLDEIAPVFTSSTGVSFAENATGTAYTSLATDAAAVTYSLGTGNDESLFNISGDAFTFKTPPDFENPNDGGNNNTYLVQVRATDVAGNTANQVVTITVTDVVEFPVFTSTPSTAHDNDQNYRYDIQVNGFEHINVTETNIPSWLSLKKTATVSTLAGNGTAGNPSSTNTRFSSPKGIVVDNATGRIFTIDQDGSFIQRIDLNGENGLHVNECSFDITCSKTNPFGFNGLQDITFGDDGNPIFIEKNSFYQITRNGNIYYEGGSGVGFADGIGGNAQFTSMQGITFDPVTKNIYVSDANRIRKIQLTSTVGQAIVSTVAGSSASGAADGQGIAASFNGLKGLTTDPSGNIFVADTANHLIRKITPTGLVSTFAGSGSNADIDGQGTSASFSYPKDIEIDHYGNLYVVTGSNKVRMITPSGQVTTIAGTGVSGFNNGDESVATFSNIQGIAIDKEGILYISDKNNHGIRKIVRSYYLEGHPNGLVGNYGVGLRAIDTQNRATDQKFTIIVGDATVPNITSPISATFHHQGTGNAYTVVATDDNSISYSLGTGNDEALFNISGSTLTFKTPPDFNNPTDSDGNNTYVVEVKASDGTNTAKQNVTISILDGPPVFTSTPVTSVDNTGAYKYDITTTGFDTEISATSKPSWSSLIKNTAVQTLLGTGSQGNSNASGTAAQFASPRAIAVDNGNFYLYSIDRFGTRVRRSNLSGGAVTFVTNLSFVDPNLVVGQEDSFIFQKLEDITVDGDGNVYMVDSEVHGVYKLANDGHILSLSGWAQGTADGNGILVPPGRTGPDAQYNAPTGIVYDYVSSSLYVSDGNRIRKVDPSTGDAITIAGSGSAGSANGLGTAAAFNGLKGLATDASGNIYAADTANHLIRKITPAGLVTTFAGSGSSIDTDGIGTLASFNSPKDIVIDPGGNLYVVTGGNKVRKITPAGIVTTVAGTGVAGFDNGNGAASTFNEITSIAMGPALNFYLVDKKNHAIRKMTRSGYSLEGTPIDVAGDFNVELTATDNLSRNTVQNFTITVNDVVDPVFTSATAVNFAENATNAAYTSVVTDASPVTFSLGTGNDEALFNIANGEVTFKSAPDFENPADGDNNNSYIIEIIALDAANNAKTQEVTITVTDVEEDVSAPVFTSTTTASFVENATGTVYVINATDNNPITYALGTENDEIFFDLNGPTITFKSIPDFEVKSSYTIEVQANDGINLSKQTVLVSITDVDEVAPVFTSPTAVSFAENGAGAAYTIVATDANDINYSLGTGNDEDLFNITDDKVSFKVAPDFETPVDADKDNAYVINVIVNDGVNSVSQISTITVTDVDENAPKVLSIKRHSPTNEFTASAGGFVTFRVTFDKPVKNVNAADFSLTTTAFFPEFEFRFITVNAVSNTIYDVKIDGVKGNGGMDLDFSLSQNIKSLNDIAFTGTIDLEETYTIDVKKPVIISSTLNSTLRKVYTEGEHMDISVVYDEAVLVNTSGGTPYFNLPFETGAKRASYLSGSGSNTLLFRYTVQVGDSDASFKIEDIELDGGEIQDFVPLDASLTTSTFIHFGVGVEAKRPSIISSSITAKTYALGNALDITVKYDEEVVVNTTNGVPSMTINIGGENRTAAYFSGSGTSSIKFRYITQEGDSDSDGVTISDIQLNGGIMEDSFGNFANLSVNTSGVEGVRVDTKAPAVISSSVVAKTYGQGDFLDVTVVYDEVVLVNTTLNTPYIPINIGSSSQRANYINGSGTNSIVFRYEMSLLNDNDGIEVLDIVPLAGKLTDEAGNNASLSSNNASEQGDVRVDTTKPVITSKENASLLENTSAFAYVITATDLNSITYSLGATNDENLFNLDGNTLTFKTAPDFETPKDTNGDNVYLVEVIASDAVNAAALLVTLTVTDIDEVKPVFTSGTTGTLKEGELGINVYSSQATDANPVSFTLGSANDERFFNINNGIVKSNFISDFENPSDENKDNTYIIEIIASDGLNTISQVVTITVTDVDENAPIFTSPLIASFAENDNRVAYTAVATDESPITYSLGTGNDGPFFSISGSDITFKTPPNFEAPIDAGKNNTYVIEVIASDGNRTASRFVTITVTNVDDTAPVFTSVTAVNYAENGTGTAYSITATDENAITYSLGTGNDESLFNLEEGIVTFKASPDFEAPADGDGNNTYLINVLASDGINTVNQNVIITVTNVDDSGSDFIAPKLITLTPENGSDVDAQSIITAKFDENIYRNNGKLRIYRKRDLSLLFIRDINTNEITINGAEVSIQLPPDLPNGDELLIHFSPSSLADGNGNLIGSAFDADTWNITITSEVPTIKSLSPVDGGVLTSGTNLEVEFTAPVFASDGKVRIFKKSNSLLLHTIDIDDPSVSI
ncbi:hypothetical protein, partial [Roseivirga sp.]|uniref:hypothetical protein n=1 Tax=Roseivirga sp. TaxID=1964215 RepID=UPI003B8AC02F